MLFFPAGDIVKSRTQCTEQGPGRWLPKPTDVVATFFALANPDLENGGGYKGTTLLWWKWLPISDVVSFLIPGRADRSSSGDYGRLNDDGRFEPNYKDWMLALAQGDVYLGAVPMLDGHIWDFAFPRSGGDVLRCFAWRATWHLYGGFALLQILL
jgi:taurine transport system permease protein